MGVFDGRGGMTRVKVGVVVSVALGEGEGVAIGPLELVGVVTGTMGVPSAMSVELAELAARNAWFEK